MLLEHAPASATPYRVDIREHGRAFRSPSRPQPPGGAAGRAAGAEVVRLGIQLILDGGLDSDNGDRLAARLGVSHRRLRHLFQTYAGITPDQLARSSRAHFACRMLDDTDLPVTDIAFASGFGSLRQFNRTMYGIFRVTPLALRARRRRGDCRISDGGLVVRLGSCSRMEWEAIVGHLATKQIAGVEHIDRDAYRRTILIDGDVGALEIRRDTSGELLMRVLLPHWRDLLHVIQKARRLFSLNADLETANGALDVESSHRTPGTWEPFEVGIRAIIGQERNDDDASGIAFRVVEEYGHAVPGFTHWGLSQTFPSALVLARAKLDGIGLTASEISTLTTFADAVVDGNAGTSRNAPRDDVVMQSLFATPGVNRKTADYVALRLAARDAMVPDRWVSQGGLRQFLGQRRSQTIRLDNSDTHAARRKSPITTRVS
jgi:AraC family transcriptional regulator of adaptative response / DNA-3-methyladenine glycosylase II